ncbi:MAG: dihydrodipicolinate synthase family protein [Caulobacteraceae bacterium]
MTATLAAPLARPKSRPAPGPVLAALSTPFRAEDLYRIDLAAMASHARWLLASGCDGLLVFGTTGEAASCSLAERLEALEALIGEGIDPTRLLVGTGLCSAAETITLTRHAARLKTAGALLLPPFYYKGVGLEGLRRHFAAVIAACGEELPPIYLYHIPKVSGVPLGPEVIGALLAEHGEAIAGVKDSSGDFANTSEVLERFPRLAVFVGSETPFLSARQAGATGVISASVNIQPQAVGALAAGWRGSQAQDLQTAASKVRARLEAAGPLVVSTKAALAAIHGSAAWARPRPPLLPLDGAEAERLAWDLRELGLAGLA